VAKGDILEHINNDNETKTVFEDVDGTVCIYYDKITVDGMTTTRRHPDTLERRNCARTMMEIISQDKMISRVVSLSHDLFCEKHWLKHKFVCDPTDPDGFDSECDFVPRESSY
jgi:hypothetical protein